MVIEKELREKKERKKVLTFLMQSVLCKKKQICFR